LGPTEEKGKGKAIATEEEDDEKVKRRDYSSLGDYVVEQSDLLTIHIFSVGSSHPGRTTSNIISYYYYIVAPSSLNQQHS
jgi:hypothetical protein